MRVVVHIDSRDRQEGTPSSYRLALPQIFRRVQRYRVLCAELAGTLDQIAGANAEFNLTVNDGPVTRIAIPTGVYTWATLQSAVTAALVQSFPELTWSVDISDVTRRASIVTAESAILEVEGTGGDLAELLGFDGDARGSVIAGERPVVIHPYTYIIAESDELRGSFVGTTGPSSCLAKISLASTAEQHLTPWMECLPAIASLNSLHIHTRVYDSQVEAMPEHSMSLELELGDSPTPARFPVHPQAQAAPAISKSKASKPRAVQKHLPKPSTADANIQAGPDFTTVVKQAGCVAATVATAWTVFM